MTTESNIFSPRRFGFCVRKHLIDNRRKLLLVALQIFLAMVLLVDVMPWIFGTYKYTSTTDKFWDIEYGWLSFAFLLLEGLIGAMTYTSVENKGGRISTFMSPSSSFEKFLTYFLVYAIGFFILFILFFFITDFLRVLTAPWYAVKDATVLPLPVDYILTGGRKYFHPDGLSSDYFEDINSVWITLGVLQFLIFFSAAIIFNAFNTLGSIVWGKRPFIKTFIFLFGLNTLSGFMLYNGWKIFFGGGVAGIEPRAVWENMTPGTMCWIVGISTLVFAGILYYISYVRFKETELVNKW